MPEIKPDSIEDLKKQLSRLQMMNKSLLDEVEVKTKAIRILVVAGHLDKVKLEQATELAGGF